MVYISNQESSPSNVRQWKSADPNNFGIDVVNDAKLDRQLQVWDSMDRSLRTTLREFEKNILWPATNGEIPQPSGKAVATMAKAVDRLFYTPSGRRRKGVKENRISDVIVCPFSVLVGQYLT